MNYILIPRSLKHVLGNPRILPSVRKLHQISVKYHNSDWEFTDFPTIFGLGNRHSY